MPNLVDMTEFSGISVTESGLISIGAEAFFTEVSPIGDFNQAILVSPVLEPFTVLDVALVNAALRPPEPQRELFRKVRVFKTDGLFRVHLLQDEDDEWGATPILSIILKTSMEPQAHTAAGFVVQDPEPKRVILVEFQQAGAGNTPENASNMEFHLTGRLAGQ